MRINLKVENFLNSIKTKQDKKRAKISSKKYCLVYLKILSIPKNSRTLKTNFEEADGLGISMIHMTNNT